MDMPRGARTLRVAGHPARAGLLPLSFAPDRRITTIEGAPS